MLTGFKKHPMLYVLVPLCLLAAAVSFYRFIVVGNYIVEYEGECDPATESCFVGCADEECSEVYYYTWVHKYAAEVREQCGLDVTECEAALTCQSTDQSCTVTYCSSETLLGDETCEEFNATSVPYDDGTSAEQGEEESFEESLPADTTNVEDAYPI